MLQELLTSETAARFNFVRGQLKIEKGYVSLYGGNAAIYHSVKNLLARKTGSWGIELKKNKKDEYGVGRGA